MKLKETRQNLGLTQIDMAKKFSVSLTTYSNWEKEVTTPNEKHQLQIENWLKEVSKNLKEE